MMILCTTPDERLEMVLMEAKDLGLRTVFCGEQMHEPTREAAHAFYLSDWNDTEELIRIGRREQISGIIGLCDKAMIPVAAVSEALDLPGSPSESMRKLLSKRSFRLLQEEAGVFCPRSAVAESPKEMERSLADLRFPVIIKPMLASSSHGMTVLQNAEGIEEAFAEASAESRNGAVCIEEYIPNDSLRIIEADVFVVGDDILWDGVRYCYRVENAPLRPVYDVYPVHLTTSEWEEFRRTVSRVLQCAGAVLGEYNVEGFFTPQGQFFIVEINPRQAGHYNPQDIERFCGVNLTRLLITTAVGDMSYYEELKDFRRTCNIVLSYSIFSEREGILDHIHMDPGLKSRLVKFRYLHGQKEGDPVLDIRHAIRPIAKAVFVFDTEDELEAVRRQITQLVFPVLR